MKNKLRTFKIAMVLSSIALLASAVNLLVCIGDGQGIAGGVSLLCCMIAVLCSNITGYSAARRQDGGQKEKRKNEDA